MKRSQRDATFQLHLEFDFAFKSCTLSGAVATLWIRLEQLRDRLECCPKRVAEHHHAIDHWKQTGVFTVGFCWRCFVSGFVCPVPFSEPENHSTPVAIHHWKCDGSKVCDSKHISNSRTTADPQRRFLEPVVIKDELFGIDPQRMQNRCVQILR